MIGREKIAAIARCALLLVMASAAAAQSGDRGKAATRAFKTEIVVRTINNLHSHSDVVSLIDLAARHGVGTINLAVKQDEDDEVPSGLVFYASRIAPRAPAYRAFDVLADTINEAHRRGVKVRAWVPQFHDQMALRAHPEWQMQAYVEGRVLPYSGKSGSEFFVNPLSPAVQAYQRSLLVEIARGYDVDGIVIDWVRFDDYNMDLGRESRAKFKVLSGQDPIDIDFATDNAGRSRWNAFRTAQIADYVNSLRVALDAVKPGLDLGVYILPPSFAEVGQDAAQFAASVSFLSPMAYFKDWGFPPLWVYGELLPQVRAAAKGIPLVPVLDEDWTDAACREVLPEIRQSLPDVSTLAWFAYGKWTQKSFERIARLRDL